MKVAYILTNYPVLYNSFVINEMLSVKNQSVDVIGLAMKESNHKKINENSLKLKGKIRFFYEFYPNLSASTGKLLARFGGILKRHVSESLYLMIGKLIFGTPEYKKKYYKLHGWNIHSYENAANYLIEQNVDIIHAGFGNRPATAALILSKKTGIPFTFVTHAYDLYVDFPFYQEKIQNAAQIFTISNYNKNYLVNECGSDSSKVSVMRVPINREFCDGIKAGPRESLQLISVCRLHPIKGLSIAIEAVAKIKNEYPDIKYIIVGDGAMKSELINLCKKLDVLDNVVFYGVAGNEEVLKLISESTIFILPSVIAENGDRDGIPTSLIEAMYLNTPAIGSNISGIPELIEDGIEGYLIEPGNVMQLVGRITELLRNKKLCSDMGVKGRDKVVNNFYKESCDEVLVREWSSIVK